MTEEIPEVLVEPAGTSGGVPQWKFRCRYCGVYHHHGGDLGHRVAHCHKANSPYRDTGYVLTTADQRGDRV